MTEIERTYLALGGKFVIPFEELKARMQKVKAIIYDWDGVFNNGNKTADSSSNFSEVDSMGTNLLRFSTYLKRGLPVSAVISGEKNDTAFYFCKRECFHYSFFKAANNKIDALNYICNTHKIQQHEVAYFFDDVLDLSMAEVCGVRIFVNQKANPLFAEYCVRNKLADYITSSAGGSFAVRESTELLVALNDNYDEVMQGRKNVSAEYKTYLEKRKSISTEFFSLLDGKMEKAEF
ncbi:MAG: phosphatase [Bacteroidetes bacterium]|nr:phosphatase [Bacteroidota bacterium]